MCGSFPPTSRRLCCAGHGLSFTEFNYSALVVTQEHARFRLHNVGPVAGTETVQLYITFPSAAEEPPRQLRAFDSVQLQAGEMINVTLPLQPRDFETWDPTLHKWVRVAGDFGVIVGSSSCDGRIDSTLTLK